MEPKGLHAKYIIAFEGGRAVGYRVGHRAGIALVRNWVEAHNLKLPTTSIPSGDPVDIALKDSPEWQSQLQEWLRGL